MRSDLELALEVRAKPASYVSLRDGVALAYFHFNEKLTIVIGLPA